ncbi:MAG: DUF2007 domain-containing protein [Bryobacteraceae bacterium]|jgi:hypothetical protein
MPEHAMELVAVLETDDSFALTLAKASLEDAGIDYLVTGDDPRYMAGWIPREYGGGMTPLGRCSCRIQVAPESEAEARALLEPLQKPGAASIVEADPEPHQ